MCIATKKDTILKSVIEILREEETMESSIGPIYKYYSQKNTSVIEHRKAWDGFFVL